MKEQSLFIQFMGDSPTIRVLDYLLSEKGLDFSITDMAKNSRIGRSTLYRIWGNLIKNEIIIPTRTIGKTKLYVLNVKSPITQRILELEKTLIQNTMEQAQKKPLMIPSKSIR